MVVVIVVSRFVIVGLMIRPQSTGGEDDSCYYCSIAVSDRRGMLSVLQEAVTKWVYSLLARISSGNSPVRAANRFIP